MKNKQIVFVEKNTATLMEVPYREPDLDEVVVETEFSTVSCGTEKANITGLAGAFPVKNMGYSSSGTVVSKGDSVRNLEIGDKVVVYWGKHARYNTVNKSQVVKIDEGINMQEAAMSFIATFPLAAIRKTRLEIGESAIVLGLGLLGQLAVKLLRASGACPIIAVDFVAERRAEALANGADYVFDPSEDGFAEKIKELTGGGVNVAIEVTGVGQGLDSALDCMAKFGRVALLGCTRDKNFTIDYYRKVHCPGITLIGAHTMARPLYESHAGLFTHCDDIKAVFKLIRGGRLDLSSAIKKTCNPEECHCVYTQLVNDPNFPITVQFDWRLLK